MRGVEGVFADRSLREYCSNPDPKVTSEVPQGQGS
jgi:hypothetical protein